MFELPAKKPPSNPVVSAASEPDSISSNRPQSPSQGKSGPDRPRPALNSASSGGHRSHPPGQLLEVELGREVGDVRIRALEVGLELVGIEVLPFRHAHR